MTKTFLSAMGAAVFAALTGAVPAGAASDMPDDQPFYGDSLTTRGRKTYYLTAPTGDDEKARALILAMNGADRVATCTIYGAFTDIVPADKNNLLVSYGAEQAYIPLKRLPHSFTMPQSPLRQQMKHICHTFNIKDAPEDDARLTYEVDYYAPTANHAGVNSMIAGVLNELWYSPMDPYLGDYADTDKMLSHYFDVAASAYKADVEETGVQFNYALSLSAEPTWQAADKAALTYRIDSYVYTGGAHGMPTLYYVTLDAQTFRPLGIADLFRSDKVADVMKLVAARINEWRSGNGAPAVADEDASIDSVEDVFIAGAAVSRAEPWQGKVYPRPALTTRGVVFSYEPYEKGSYAEGQAHVVLTYAEVADALSPKAAALVR